MELSEAVRRRRMVRNYPDEPIDADVLDRVLAAARRAPSAGNTQALDLLVVLLVLSQGVKARCVKAFAADRRPASERAFRWFNEVPTVLFIGIVLLAVFRPG